jgi:hypothetical protein
MRCPNDIDVRDGNKPMNKCKGLCSRYNPLFLLARTTGLEIATSGVTGAN